MEEFNLLPSVTIIDETSFLHEFEVYFPNLIKQLEFNDLEEKHLRTNFYNYLRENILSDFNSFSFYEIAVCF